jgi:DNA-binding MarR family transcriptional regulator
VTGLIDRLEAKGMVRRVPDPGDRRRVIVEAVAEKLTAAAPFFARIQKALDSLVEVDSDEQLETILDFMRRSAERSREVTAAITQLGETRGGRKPRMPGAPRRVELRSGRK